MEKLEVRTVKWGEACAFVRQVHRHLGPPQGWKFGLGVWVGDQLVGVVMVGRPVSRVLDDGATLEITRLCTDGTPNACSKLLGAARRAMHALGYRRLITYSLDEEKGGSLRAAGFAKLGRTKGGKWSTPSRARSTQAPTGHKRLWMAE